MRLKYDRDDAGRVTLEGVHYEWREDGYHIVDAQGFEVSDGPVRLGSRSTQYDQIKWAWMRSINLRLEREGYSRIAESDQ